MRSPRTALSILVTGALVLGVTSCSNGTTSDGPVATADTGECTTLTVLTNRSDQISTTFAEYKKEFESTHEGVEVKFEAPDDYEGDVKTRLNTKDYGDVLNIPNGLSATQYPKFFSPLGSSEDLAEKYFFTAEGSFEGTVYGLSQTGLAGGYIVNLSVWAEAGITEPPATPEEFLADLALIKSKTDAIPLYTNYKDGWPLSMYVYFDGLVAGPESYNERIADTTPWERGSELYIADSLLFDSVHEGLTEDDPTTTDWGTSQSLLATGKVATLIVPLFAVSQIQQAATDAGADPADVGFWPLPVQSDDGSFQSLVTGEYKVAINKYSQCQGTAREWVDYFLDESGFASSVGSLPTLRTGTGPASLDYFAELGVTYVEMDGPKAGEEGLYADIQKEAGLQFLSDFSTRQKLIDIARGAAAGTKDEYFDQLNDRWAQAIATVGQN
jgi:raffinose/stachyose/melibiose transport system substrate-binding protein